MTNACTRASFIIITIICIVDDYYFFRWVTFCSRFRPYTGGAVLGTCNLLYYSLTGNECHPELGANVRAESGQIDEVDKSPGLDAFTVGV